MSAIDDMNNQRLHRWLTAPEAAAMLPNVSARTVQRWAQQGRIPAERLPGGRYRIRRAEIDRLLGASS